ncbi:hypothetical protein [Mycobacterium lepromatosis]|uniref:hypothetical protein n=1 Tax=Mycobacterium lepromatosis TaxID=480418 RepID=UPI000A581B97|nr:hypothetical protein [Mycobacterium lepromatosis]
MFNDPDSGSDLVEEATRTVRDGYHPDDWIVNGQKVWTLMAQHVKMAILVACIGSTVLR